MQKRAKNWVMKMAYNEKHAEKVSEGEHDEDVYEAEGREDLVEDDEISPEEEGLLEGYSDDVKEVKCANCGKALFDEETVVEREFNDKIYRFCSEKCAKAYDFKKEDRDK
jgi:endogenous inhibitor of DNA gyrase (YacG/DUF329 family)